MLVLTFRDGFRWGGTSLVPIGNLKVGRFDSIEIERDPEDSDSVMTGHRPCGSTIISVLDGEWLVWRLYDSETGTTGDRFFRSFSVEWVDDTSEDS